MTEATNDRLGAVLRDGDRVGLRYERMLAHRPEKVWAALTESEHLRHWFPADIVGPRERGAEVQLPFWPESVEAAADDLAEQGIDLEDPTLPGRILEWEPPRVFALTWGNAEGEADHLHFELTPVPAGTRLVFTTWLGVEGPQGHAGTGAGWHACLHALIALVDGSDDELAPEDVADLQRRYAAHLA